MDFFPQFFPFLLVWFTKKLDHFSNSLDFAADHVSGCLTRSSVSVFSENWRRILIRFMPRFLSPVLCKVLLWVLSGTLSGQRLPCEDEGHVSNNERQHSHIHVWRKLSLLSLSKFNDNLGGELFNGSIFCIEVIISKPKTSPHVLGTLQAPIPSAIGNLIYFSSIKCIQNQSPENLKILLYCSI